MTTALSNIVAEIPYDSELMVKRLFKVAEILSRNQATAEADEFYAENGPEKHANEEIKYLETKDQFSKA